MAKGPSLESQIEEAEAALRIAEVTYGSDSLKVSYCLDKLAQLLRSRGIRTLDAANMAARAQAIRIKSNNTALKSIESGSDDTFEAIRIAARRRQKEKLQRTLLLTGWLGAWVVIIVKFMMAPSPGQWEAAQSLLTKVQDILPSTAAENLLDRGRAIAKEAEDANKKHNDQVEEYLGDK